MYQLKISFWFISLIAISYQLQAQDTSATISKVSIASPTAAALGKFGDVPVSYHTGIPNVNIPIYTISSGSLKVPISLSYHAAGLKVQENSSWVGAGFSLNAGGVITRTVNGAPDDRGISTANICTNGYYSDYGYHNYLWIFGTGAGSTPDGFVADDRQFVAGKKDGEPDLFFFNFAGYTGKFYFNDDRTPILVPGTDLRIRPDFAVGTGFSGFVVTTPDGNQYYFGKTGNNSAIDPIEISVTGTLQYNYASANAAVSSWYLNKIMSADGLDSITFEYASENYSYHTISMFPVSSTLVPYFSGPGNIEYNLAKNFINGVRLSKINFRQGNILFTPASSARLDLSGSYSTDGSLYDADNTEARALGSISIKNSDGTLCKKDTFFYDYWYDNNSSLNGLLGSTAYNIYNLHTDKYRLRLDSMQEMSCDNSIKTPPYRFSYFTEFVPRRLMFGIDHWGFYNGVTNNQTLIPTLTISSTNLQRLAGANRDAAWPAMRGGALEKITYPTGGYTKMDFEANDTWCEYDTYSYILRISRGAGWDGHNGGPPANGSNPDTIHVSLTGNPYHIVLSNSSSGGSAQVTINRISDNSIAYVLNANAGETKEDDIILSAGNYWIQTLKNNASTGAGCSMDMYEWVPESVASNKLVGGLRIKSITTYDSISSQNTVTNYSYRVSQNPAGQSTGILYSKPVYIQVVRNDAFALVWGAQGNCSPAGCASCDGTGEHAYLKSPGTIRPLATTQGNHIGYNEVFVSQTGNGYSVYRYYGSNYWDNKISDVCTRFLLQSNICDTSIPNYPSAPLSFEPMRGELKYEGFYNENGYLMKDVWHFPRFAQNAIYTPGIISSNISNLYTFTTYSLLSYHKIKDSTEETTYVNPGGSYATTVNSIYYASNFHHQPDRKSTITSTNDTLITLIKYAFDFSPPSCLIAPDSTAYFLNLIHTDSANLISEVSTCSPQYATGYNNCRYGVFQKYRRYISLNRIKLINYLRNNYSDSARYACLAGVKTAADHLLKPVIQMQEEYRNLPIEISNYRNGKTIRSSFTHYDYADNPSTKVYPRINQLIDLKEPVTDFSPAQATNTSITKDNRYVDENTARYLSGNMVDVNLKNGVTVSYLWDYDNTMRIVECLGAADSTIAYSSFESNGNGNWAIGSTSRDSTQAITGKRAYQLSGGDVTKAGLTGTSEYYLSYWTKNSAAFTITGTQGTAQQGRTINGWTYFIHKITGVTLVTLSGTGIIDELRLYPKAAQMTTYTYDPLIGVTSKCDISNNIQYYEYDSLGRLKLIRDQDRNILKTFSYKYQELQ